MGFGKEIKRLREEANTTAQQIVNAIELESLNRYKSWEQGDFTPKFEDRQLIESFFKMTLEEISQLKTLPIDIVERIQESNQVFKNLKIVFSLFKDAISPDPTRERIKKVIGELRRIFPLKDIYLELGIKPKDGSKVFIGFKSHKSFVDALVAKFNVNPDYIYNGTEPIFLNNQESGGNSDKTPISEWSAKKLKETSSFPDFIRGIGNVFSDMLYKDPFRERIKNAVYELHEVYQSKEIYRRMGIPPYLGNEVLFGVTSPKSFIDALVSEFNINYAYIMDGTLPIRLPKNPDEKENLIKAIAEKDKLISAQQATIDSQKITIDSQQKLIATLQKT